MVAMQLVCVATYAQTADLTFNAPFSHNGNTSGNNYQEVYSIDNDGDGIVDQMLVSEYDTSGNLLRSARIDRDGIPTYVKTFTYDSLNNLTGEYIDHDADGAISSWVEYTYDTNSNRLTKTNYSGTSGIFFKSIVDVYDPNGNLLSSSTYWYGDTIPSETKTYTYNADGNILNTVEDNDGDSIPDKLRFVTYHPNGVIDSIIYDNDADGINETVNVFNLLGSLVLSLQDSNDDGVVDKIEQYTYDADGNKLTYSLDSNNDGVIDTYIEYSYDQNGLLISRLTTNLVRTERIDYIYDQNGNLLSKSTDADNDGAYDVIVTYTYDPDGNNLTHSIDYQADGSIDYIETYTYDSVGRVLTYIEDEDRIGNYEEEEYYVYDTAGRGLSYTLIRDGVIVYIVVLTYDADGNILTRTIDDGGDGSIDEIYTYTYSYSGDNCVSLGSSQDKVYAVKVPYDGDWKFSLCNSSFNTTLFIGSSICSDDIGSNDDACGSSSEYVASALGSGLYFVTVSGANMGDEGDYELVVTDVTVIDTTVNIDTVISSISSMNNEELLSVDLNVSPNPFSTNLTIEVEMAETKQVVIEVYNLQGRFIHSLYNGQLTTGKHTIAWDAKDGSGATISAGYYICRMQVGEQSIVKQIVRVQ